MIFLAVCIMFIPQMSTRGSLGRWIVCLFYVSRNILIQNTFVRCIILLGSVLVGLHGEVSNPIRIKLDGGE